MEQKVKEWNRLNSLLLDAKPGADMLIVAHMDKIAKEIGYPETKSVYEQYK